MSFNAGMKYKPSPTSVVLQCSAVMGLLALVMAWGTPSAIAVQANCLKQVICLAPGDTPRISYFKGDIEYQSRSAEHTIVKGKSIAAGDSIETGENGFAWIKLASDRSYSIQPNSQTRFSSWKYCATAQKKPSVDQTGTRAAFLFAAVRG